MGSFFLGIIGVLILIAVGGLIYLRLSCNAIEIIKTHADKTQYVIINRQGNGNEPANCGGFPIVIGME